MNEQLGEKMINKPWEDMECLIIRSGGKLINRFIDDEKNFKEEDVTNQAIEKLFQPCFIDKGVILKDIFDILKIEPEIFNMILNNWTKDMIIEFYANLDKAQIYNPDPNQGIKEIQYLELYKCIEIDNEFNISGLNFVHFDGVSFPALEDYEPDDDIHYKKGEICKYGIEFTPPYEMANYPIRLNHNIKIIRDHKFHNAETVNYYGYKLKDILYSIVWELSFLGSPENRNQEKILVNNLVDQIKKEINHDI